MSKCEARKESLSLHQNAHFAKRRMYEISKKFVVSTLSTLYFNNEVTQVEMTSKYLSIGDLDLCVFEEVLKYPTKISIIVLS